jgi:hypothetical protein
LYEEATTAPLPICFPDEVVTKLQSVFGTYPSWDLIFAASGKVVTDPQLEKTFAADLEHLCEDEDSFQLPLDDPHYCLLLGHMRDCWKRFEAKLSDNEDQDEKDADEEDEADWWKSAE